MQQMSTWYFALGNPIKSSFCAEFCRENDYTFLQDPQPASLREWVSRNVMIEGSLELLREAEKMKTDLSIVVLGKDCDSEEEQQLIRQYQQIGRCICVPTATYQHFRRNIYPNLIFVYGPLCKQNGEIACWLSELTGYCCIDLPNSANDFLEMSFDKNQNYVVNGFFTTPQEIQVLECYFNIRIVHLKYEREDLQNYQSFFDTEYDLLPYLKCKPYMVCVQGNLEGEAIMAEVGKGLCPRLIYVNGITPDNKPYITSYLQETNSILLQVSEIEQTCKRKNIPFGCEKLQQLTKLLYRDLQRKQLLICDFPVETEDFRKFEKCNRCFSFFVDLIDQQKYEYSKDYCREIYFLEKQGRVVPNFDNTLAEELAEKTEYWLVNGPGTCGKSTVAKYIQSEFGFKLIEYEAYIATIKEKLLSPEDGEEVPLRKYLAHFKQLFQCNKNTTHIIDGLPYTGNDLAEWVKVVGCPTVLNLRVDDNEQIKRARKKAEGDVNAEITEEDTAKVQENNEKNAEWVERIGELSPSSKIYSVDYNMPSILAEPLLNLIMRPRIYLVQKNDHVTFQNIAIKYNMGYVNLETHPLRETQGYVKKCGKRDIILNYYCQQEDKHVSDDLYWIEKNLGEIRYIGVWHSEAKEVHEEMLVLERPPVEEKPKKPEGEGEDGDGEPENQQEDPDGEPKKKKFDIYEHQWTNPTTHKNLSQWFFKLKKCITQRGNCEIDCFSTFSEVLELINSDRDANIYQELK